MIVKFLSATNAVLGTSDSTVLACQTSNPGWCSYSKSTILPVGTRRIEYTMKFNRNSGTEIDAYIDDNSLRVV